MITDGNRFIEREYFIVREYVKMDAIEPLWQMRTKNPSDLGTKAVTKQIYDQLINKLTGAEKKFKMPLDEHKLRYHEPFDDENAHYCGAYTWDDGYLSHGASGEYSIRHGPAKFYSDVMSSSHENTDAWKMSRAGFVRGSLIEDLFLNPAVLVLLFFAPLPDCSQNQIAVSDALRLLSDF
jgi:hypothetical protein